MKLVMALVVATAGVLGAATSADDPPADRANTTVFDVFELSPEQFATMMSHPD